MCDPVTMTIMAVASTAAGIVGQVQSAKSQTAAIQAQATQAATEAASKASGETNDRLREARREQSRIKVAAGEAGLQLGGSIDLLLRDSQLQSSMAAGRIQDNQGRENGATSAEANSMLSRVTSPTLLGAGLQIAGAGIQGYGAGQSIQAQRPRVATPKAATP
jgi:hypothetical protein